MHFIDSSMSEIARSESQLLRGNSMPGTSPHNSTRSHAQEGADQYLPLHSPPKATERTGGEYLSNDTTAGGVSRTPNNNQASHGPSQLGSTFPSDASSAFVAASDNSLVGQHSPQPPPVGNSAGSDNDGQASDGTMPPPPPPAARSTYVSRIVGLKESVLSLQEQLQYSEAQGDAVEVEALNKQVSGC